MAVPAPLIALGKTFGVAAVVGTAAGLGTRAVLNNTEGTTRDTLATVAKVGGAVAAVAFWLTPGLPNKPIATGLIMGTMGGLLLGSDIKSDVEAAAAAVQKTIR